MTIRVGKSEKRDTAEYFSVTMYKKSDVAQCDNANKHCMERISKDEPLIEEGTSGQVLHAHYSFCPL